METGTTKNQQRTLDVDVIPIADEPTPVSNRSLPPRYPSASSADSGNDGGFVPSSSLGIARPREILTSQQSWGGGGIGARSEAGGLSLSTTDADECFSPNSIAVENDGAELNMARAAAAAATAGTTFDPLLSSSNLSANGSLSVGTTSPALITSPSFATAVDHVGGSSSCVKVAVRVRPLLGFEAGNNCIQVLPPVDDHGGGAGSGAGESSSLRIGGSAGPQFTFDRVFGPRTDQDDIYRDQVAPLVQSCLEGYNATVFAYGQTGSGKTYTIMGGNPRSSFSVPSSPSSSSGTATDAGGAEMSSASISLAVRDDQCAGVIPRAITALFDALEEQKSIKKTHDQDDQYDGQEQQTVVDSQVQVQFLELYGEEIRDLLAPSGSGSDKLTIRDMGGHGQDEPEVMGATSKRIYCAEEALLCLTQGMLRRVTGSTAMNASSSRSHAILSIMVEQQTKPARGTAVANDGIGDKNTNMHTEVKRSKFVFVDLAGSERQKKTHAEGKRLKEGIDINKGLLVLGNVISALGDPKKRGKTFVPYRDSKLTRLLKGGLGGNHKTLMIACVSPSSTNLEESLNCLRYANRAKNIQNNAIVNLDPSSRLVAELQGQVQALAAEVLRAWDGDVEGRSFTRETIESLAAGASVSGGSVSASPMASGRSGFVATSATTSGRSPSPQTRGGGFLSPTSRMNGSAQAAEQRLKEWESELVSIRDQLRESQRNHDMAEEQLHSAKAEKELYRLQLSFLSAEKGNVPGTGDEAFQKLVLSRVAEYEKELENLRTSLRAAEAKATRMALEGTYGSYSLAQDESESSIFIERANRELGLERERLLSLQHSMSVDSDSEANDLFMTTSDPAGSGKAVSRSSSNLEEVERAEQEELNTLTGKYLAQGGHDDEDGGVGPSEVPADPKEPSNIPAMKQKLLQADLAELSKSIAAKEELINRLKTSQEKYASMRTFYEEKLKQMEGALYEKEAEREKLMRELHQLKENDVSSKEIEAQVREQDKVIAKLKKKHQELKNLTSVSSRNENEISRLLEDVKTMKRRKVDLQKQLLEERKKHNTEMKKLQKTALQKDREVVKWKKMSHQKEIAAQKSSQVAKHRLEELGQLREKYKDSERRLRMQSVKQGVMAKAGLDAVIVGRRETKAARRETSSYRLSRHAEVDADSLRDYFDQKVADVVRKEVLADKLAEEWEEHYMLTARKNELSDLPENEEQEEALQSLKVQLQFKEERIRQYAQRFGKQRLNVQQGSAESAAKDQFLYGSEFAKISRGCTPERAKSTAARVLFGMIVRERRRVSNLARTASALDDRVQAAESAAAVSEAALRSYKAEQAQELAALSNAQQEHLLSLMDMVKDEAMRSSILTARGADSGQISPELAPQLLVLANGRIDLLERQLEHAKSNAYASESYRSELDELAARVKTKSSENDGLSTELSFLRSVLRQIREAANRPGASSDAETLMRSTILDIIEEALHPSTATSPQQPRRRNSRSAHRSTEKFDRSVSRRVKKHVELMHTSDSADDSAPEWANDIMADLAIIADGKMPPILKSSAPAVEQQTDGGSVFDRLANPQSFTGTQKHVQEKIRSPRSPIPRGQEERVARSAEIASRLERIVLPTAKPPTRADETAHADRLGQQGRTETDIMTGQKTARSVFDRLISPSQYTGTQKEKFNSTKAKRDRAAEDAADRVLTGILHHSSRKEERRDVVAEPNDGKRSGYEDYTQQDVFERLQKTTTHAYAVKQSHMHDDESRSASPQTAAVQHDDAARRHARPSDETPAHEKSYHSDYTSQDVFERLQRTTTEAYANKARREE